MDTVNIYLLGNAFSIWDLIVSIAAAFALGLSVYLAIVEHHRYRIPLQMVLKEIDYRGLAGCKHLILIWVSFVNPASVGKTVFLVLGGAPNSEAFSLCPYQLDRPTDTVIFQPPNSEKGYQVAKSESLWLPLDIPPHQSETKVFLALLTQDAVNQALQVHLRLKAFDVLRNKLAEIDQTIELKTYQLF